jgi:curli production assembly/transport component CsgE
MKARKAIYGATKTRALRWYPIAIVVYVMIFATSPVMLAQSSVDSVQAEGLPTDPGATVRMDSSDVAQQVAEEARMAQEEQSLSLELSGLIVDETQTKIGRDFYEFFYAMWQAPEGASDFTITVTERPMPRHGTQIKVVVNDFEVMQQFLQPRADVIEETALYAVQRAYGFLQNYQSILEQLQGDDMAGSGIF